MSENGEMSEKPNRRRRLLIRKMSKKGEMSEKPNRRRRLLIIGGGLFLLCMCFFVAVVALISDSDGSTEAAGMSDDTQAEPVEVEVTRIVEVEVEIPVAVRVDATRIVEVEVEIPVAVGVDVTRIVEVEVEIPVAVEVEVTRDVEVIVTAAPTITKTPVPTNTPTPTEDVTKQSRGDGTYLIGSAMSPGLWRSTPGQDNCYWEVRDANGDATGYYNGDSGGVASIPASGFQFDTWECGQWEYLG